MAIELEKVCNENYSFYTEYEKAYDDNIKKYQSRIYPIKESELLHWYHIKVDGKYIGAIWLEKEFSKDHFVLGIFIAYESYRNKGYGSEAIKKILTNISRHTPIKRVLLHVRAENERAIRCYNKIGFAESSRYYKNGLSIIEMTYTI